MRPVSGASRGKSNDLFECKNPDRAALGHLGELAWENPIEVGLHAARITTPAGVHGDVLLAVDAERDGWRENTGVGGKLPKQFTGRCIEGVEFSIVGAAAED